MKRNIFQIHLSTAITLMIVSGGLLWLNCGETVKYSYVEIRSGQSEPVFSQYRIFGWPLELNRYDNLAAFYAGYYVDSRGNTLTTTRPSPQFSNFNWKLLFIDITIALLILISVGCFFEWRIGLKNRARQAVPLS